MGFKYLLGKRYCFPKSDLGPPRLMRLAAQIAAQPIFPPRLRVRVLLLLLFPGTRQPPRHPAVEPYKFPCNGVDESLCTVRRTTQSPSKVRLQLSKCDIYRVMYNNPFVVLPTKRKRIHHRTYICD